MLYQLDSAWKVVERKQSRVFSSVLIMVGQCGGRVVGVVLYIPGSVVGVVLYVPGSVVGVVLYIPGSVVGVVLYIPGSAHPHHLVPQILAL